MIRQQSEYSVGIYCRISKDDGKLAESSSIATQKSMLTAYVKEQGWKIYNTYVDDGCSGLNFNRPSFKLMKEDVENGRINLVITKDLSRLGRNYLETGAFIEIFFPERGCRYIALTDGVDTLNSINADITPFKNLLNEMYSKDIAKKVSAAKRAKTLEGKFIGTTPPYGYVKSPQNKNLLIIDVETAPTIRRIFRLAQEGLGIAKIRKILTAEKVPRPSYYTWRGTGNFDRFYSSDEDPNLFKWSNNSVRGILVNPVYMGAISGYKRTLIGLKSKRRITQSPKNWVIVENTHEAIIPKEEFNLVQRLIKSRRIIGHSGYDNIFSGLIKCAECGYAMASGRANRKWTDNAIENITYTCNHYRIYGKSACTSHNVEAVSVYKAVLEDIKKHAKIALMGNNILLQKVLSKVNANSTSEINDNNKELRKSKNRLTELDKLYMSLYEDRTNNIINDRNYTVLKEKYEDEQSRLEKRIEEIEAKLMEQSDTIENSERFVEMIKDYADLIELDAPLLNRLIKRVTIGEAYLDENNELQQEICIYYNFVGKLD